MYRIPQDILANLLRIAIGRLSALARRLLRNRQHLGLAVYRAGGRENDIANTLVTHQFEDGDKRLEVIPVVKQRFVDRFTHRLRRREMDDRIELILIEDTSHRLFVGAIHLFEGNLYAGNLANTLDRTEFGVRQVVDDHHIVSGPDQLDGRVRTDIPGSTCNQYCLFHLFQLC